MERVFSVVNDVFGAQQTTVECLERSVRADGHGNAAPQAYNSARNQDAPDSIA